MATIRKRNNKWQVQVRRAGQVATSKTFKCRTNTAKWARQQETAADRGELSVDLSPLRKITLGDLVSRYLEEVTPRKRSAVAEKYVLRKFRAHPICKKSLANITTSAFSKYRDERLAVISPSGLKRELVPVRNIFEVARRDWGIPIKENPLDQLRLKFVDQRRERRLKEGELDRIISEARKCKNPYVVPVILFAIETGMRRGEILAVTWDDLDTTEETLRIPQSKNGYSRCIPLSGKALAILESLQPVSERVFPTTANALRLNWERVKKRAGIDDLHFHDLRHEAISRFFELGLTVPEVALISGHRDTRMLLRYAHGDTKVVQRKLGNWTYTT
ncbi:MAG: site-specific integrase [Rhizobiales bacterium]|nr:site-specific integrase [Hyphomicrobiales bacterium]